MIGNTNAKVKQSGGSSKIWLLNKNASALDYGSGNSINVVNLNNSGFLDYIASLISDFTFTTAETVDETVYVPYKVTIPLDKVLSAIDDESNEVYVSNLIAVEVGEELDPEQGDLSLKIEILGQQFVGTVHLPTTPPLQGNTTYSLSSIMWTSIAIELPSYVECYFDTYSVANLILDMSVSNIIKVWGADPESDRHVSINSISDDDDLFDFVKVVLTTCRVGGSS